MSRISKKTEQINIAMTSEMTFMLNAIAHFEGATATELVRGWIRDRITDYRSKHWFRKRIAEYRAKHKAEINAAAKNDYEE